jgi:hypothetical protein
MDLDFGHGFLPRIGEENYKAVDRCVGPADLFADPLDLPWAIVDGAWAEGKPELLGTLRQHDTKLLVDTFGWRYRYEATGDVAKLRGTSWAPQSVVSMADRTTGKALVEASLRAQAALGADAYLVPGWVPDSASEDLQGPYETILTTAGEFDDVAAKPLVLFVGGHTQGPEQVVALLDQIPHFVSAIYLQLSPVSPSKDSPAKLESLTALYQHAAARGFQVIAGHAGAITPALRALGVDAADAGLATTETFATSRARAKPRKNHDDETRGGGRRSRMYFDQIGCSLAATEVERILGVPGAAAQLRTCRLPCHRFRGDHMLEQAREHSLWARVTDAQLVNSLPPSMRATSVYERTKNQRSVLTTINGALEAAGEKPLDVKQLDNRLTWIARAVAMRSAA